MLCSPAHLWIGASEGGGIEMGVALERGEAGSLITLEGVVDISSAAELKGLMIESLQGGKGVSVSVAGATYLDVTALQLLWALQRATQSAGQGFAFTDEFNDSVSTDLGEAGFAPSPFSANSLAQNTGSVREVKACRP